MIINLTQHPATAEQADAGVIDLPSEHWLALVALLTFDVLPTADEIQDRAADIAELACYNDIGEPEGDSPQPQAAMIGGAPWLMPSLERALRERAIRPLYAFSLRHSVEEPQADGSVRKVNHFRHVGFVEGLPG